MTPVYKKPKTLRDASMHFCPGCGHGILHKLLAEIIDELGIRERTIGVAPVGCSVVLYDYLDLDISESAHGRAPAVATGISRCLPGAVVFAYQGDGDLASIGTAEVIHAANRGEHYVTVFVNNTIYGMTGGQMAPTTMVGQASTTCPGGRDPETMGNPMRMCEMLSALDSPSLIARVKLDGPAGIRKTRATIKQAFEYQMAGKKFPFVEVLSPCPTHWKPRPGKRWSASARKWRRFSRSRCSVNSACRTGIFCCRGFDGSRLPRPLRSRMKGNLTNVIPAKAGIQEVLA
jgi:2-oxoglutarate ferredoxin oxidoreductase subunit beta